jgi:methionyl-tRNA formyltransferase
MKIKTNKVKIAFVGGGERSLISFTQLTNRDDIDIKYSIFMPGYEDEHVYCLELEKIAKDKRLDFISSDKITAEIIKKVNSLDLDVILDGGLFRSYVKPEFWKNARYGFIAPHGSLLPAYKGWAGINWYIINGEREYGLQVFQVSGEIDSGKLAIRKDDKSLINVKVSLENQLMIREILDVVNEENARLILETIELIKNDNIDFIEPNDSESTWTCSRGVEDGEINWDQPTFKVFNFIRAQTQPYPGAFSYYDGERIFFWKIKIPKVSPKYVGIIPGRIVKVDKKHGLIWVMTKDGVIEVSQVSFENTKEQIKPPTEYFVSVREKFGFDYYKELKKIKALLNF